VFEDDIVAALANREIEAAAVHTGDQSAGSTSKHADKPLRLISGVRQRSGFELETSRARACFRPPDDQAATACRCGDRGAAWRMALIARIYGPLPVSSCDPSASEGAPWAYAGIVPCAQPMESACGVRL